MFLCTGNARSRAISRSELPISKHCSLRCRGIRRFSDLLFFAGTGCLKQEYCCPEVVLAGIHCLGVEECIYSWFLVDFYQ